MSLKLTNSKVFVTGGSGFIAPYILNELAEKNSVTVHFRDPSKVNREVLNSSIKIIVGDLGDKQLFDEVPKQLDFVLHLAGAVLGPDSKTILANNVVSTTHLLKLLETHSVPKFIFMSTASVWDDGFGRRFNEQIVPTPTTPYGYAKLAAEGLIQDAFLSGHLKSVVVLRCNNTYGVGSIQGAVANFFKRISNDQPIEIDGDGQQLREPIYISDMIDLIYKSLNVETGYNVYGISGPEAVTVRQIAETIAKVLNKDLVIDWKPKRSDRSTHLQIDCTKAQKELGWIPKVRFEEGIRLMTEKLKNV